MAGEPLPITLGGRALATVAEAGSGLGVKAEYGIADLPRSNAQLGLSGAETFAHYASFAHVRSLPEALPESFNTIC